LRPQENNQSLFAHSGCPNNRVHLIAKTFGATLFTDYEWIIDKYFSKFAAFKPVAGQLEAVGLRCYLKVIGQIFTWSVRKLC